MSTKKLLLRPVAERFFVSISSPVFADGSPSLERFFSGLLRKGRRPPPPWSRTPLRPKRAKKRRWAPLRPRPRRPINEVQGWGIFDRHNEEFSTGIDKTEQTQKIARAINMRKPGHRWMP